MKNKNKDKEINEKLARVLKWAPILLTSIKPIPNARYEYTQTFKVSGYVHLISIVEDLIKLCALATSMDPPQISPLVRKGPIDISGILELVLQIIPSNEMELLENMADFVEKNILSETPTKKKKSKIPKKTP